MKKQEIMQAAHRMASHILFDSNYKATYRDAMSQALKTIYFNINMLKTAKNELTSIEKELILSSGEFLQIETLKNNEFINQDLVNTLKKYSYKEWSYPCGHAFFFSNELINTLK